MAEADSTPTEEQASEGTNGLDDALSQALQDFGSQTEPSDDQATEAEPSGDESQDQAEASDADEAGEKTQASDDAEAAGEQEEGEKAEGLEPPEDWRQDQRETFQKLPREAQDLVLQQYKDFQKGFTRKSQELSDDARFAQDVRRVFDDTGIRSQIQQAGLTEADAIRRLAGAHYHLQNRPAEAIQGLAKQYGVDLEALVYGDESGSQNQEPADPEVAKLQQQVGNVTNYLQQQEAARQQSHAQQLQQQINEFAQATDDQGNPKHPHFNEVQQRMAKLIQAGEAQGLEDAYEQAVWLDRDIRQKQLEAERKRVADEEARKRKEAAEKAKKAGRNPRGNTGSSSGQSQPSGLDAILDDAIGQHGL